MHARSESERRVGCQAVRIAETFQLARLTQNAVSHTQVRARLAALDRPERRLADD
jgi:hypothetical protein